MNSGGGLWSTPSIDDDGTLYMDVANPAPFPGTPKYPNGSSRPGPNLYTNSLVALNARTGKIKWYFQAVPHDIRDYDLETPPILATFTIGGKPRDVVISGGKMGTVYVVDRHTGRLIWKRNVGIHNKWGNPARPFPTKKSGFPVNMYPGNLGGIETPMSLSHGTIYVPVVNLCTKITAQENYPAGIEVCDLAKAHGEVNALDGATGRMVWKRKLPTTPFGAATVVNDVVFTPGFDGKVYALRRSDGKVLASPAASAAVNAPPAISGDTLYLGAGLPAGAGQTAALQAWLELPFAFADTDPTDDVATVRPGPIVFQAITSRHTTRPIIVVRVPVSTRASTDTLSPHHTIGPRALRSVSCITQSTAVSSATVSSGASGRGRGIRGLSWSSQRGIGLPARPIARWCSLVSSATATARCLATLRTWRPVRRRPAGKPAAAVNLCRRNTPAAAQALPPSALAPRAPPPSHSKGRLDPASASARACTLSASGSTGRSGSGRRSAGRSSKVACTSMGISMLTGPQGGVKARRAASRRVARAVSALRMRKAALPTDCSMASWAGASWM